LHPSDALKGDAPPGGFQSTLLAALITPITKFSGGKMKFTFHPALSGRLTVLACFLGATGATHAQPQDLPAAPPQTLAANKGFVESFEGRWSAARDLAVAVADAMPAESYDFKPVPAEMSFGEQILHIAEANYGKCAVIADVKSPYAGPGEGAKIEKAAAVRDLAASFDYCTKILQEFDATKLFQMRAWGPGRFSTMDMMLGLMVHMAHHRGQAEVYLRSKGITPPKYKW
jgi:uncharacterized damage-inducible protein DinB